jgi:MFS family permease
MVLLILPAELAFITFAYPLNALTNIGAAFQTTQVAWLQTAFALSAAVTATLTGKVADQFGKRFTLLALMGLVGVGSLIAALAPSFAVLLIGRMLQGVALSIPFLMPALIRDVFPPRTVPLAVSMAAAGSGLLSVGATLAVGSVIENLGWEATFWVPALISALLILVVRLLVPEGAVRGHREPLDVLGALLLGVGVGGVLFAVSLGPTWGWTSGRILAAGAVGLVLLAVWWARSLRIEQPLVDLRQLATLPMLVTFMIAAIAIASATWFYVLMPMVALTPGADWGLGLSHDQEAALASAYSVGTFIAGFMVGKTLSRFSAPAVAAGVLVASSLGYAVAAMGLQSPLTFALATLVVGGVGGAGYAIAYNLVILITPPSQQATMSAVVTLAGNLLSAALPVLLFAVMNSMATVAPDGMTRLYPVEALWVATLVPAALGLVGTALALTLRRNGRLAAPAVDVIDAATTEVPYGRPAQGT